MKTTLRYLAVFVLGASMATPFMFLRKAPTDEVCQEPPQTSEPLVVPLPAPVVVPSEPAVPECPVVPQVRRQPRIYVKPGSPGQDAGTAFPDDPDDVLKPTSACYFRNGFAISSK